MLEVDGSQHETARLVDRERDTLLRKAGIPTVRVTTEELRAEKGPGLEGVFEATRKALAGRNSPNPWHPLVWGPLQTHRLMLAICESADAGFLSGERWVIELSDPTGLSAGLIGPYLETLAALTDIWGAGDSVPKVIAFRGDVEVVYRRSDEGFGYEQTHELGTSGRHGISCGAVAERLVAVRSNSPAPIWMARRWWWFAPPECRSCRETRYAYRLPPIRDSQTNCGCVNQRWKP